MHVLLTPVSSLSGIGKITLVRLAQEKIFTVRDLLLIKPRRIDHIPLRNVKESLGKLSAIRVRIESVVVKPKILRIICTDTNLDKLHLICAQAAWLKNLPIGSSWIVEGMLAIEKDQTPVISHPDWHKSSDSWNEYRLVYPSIRNLPQSRLRYFVAQAVELVKNTSDYTLQTLCRLHSCAEPSIFRECIRILGISEARAHKHQMQNVSIGKAIALEKGGIFC